MKHPHKQDWNDYIAQRLSPAENEQYEQHLYSCDRCLSVYMSCIEQHAARMPFLSDGATFTEGVMRVISNKKQPSERQPFYRRTLFHYSAAAVITLMLMTSGMFQSIVTVASDVESLAVSKQKTSLSSQLMHRAGNVLNTLDPTTRRELHE